MKRWARHVAFDIKIALTYKNKPRGPLSASKLHRLSDRHLLAKFSATFGDRVVSRGQRGGSPTVVNLSFLDRCRYFTFK
jgi:hypothetical protein